MRMNLASKLVPCLAAGAILAAAPTAFAGVSCPATVNYVQVGYDSTVAVNVTSSGVGLEFQLCTLNQTPAYVGQNNVTITPDTCRSWVTLLNAAALSGRPITFYIQDGQSCTANKYWAARATNATPNAGKGLYAIQQ